MRQVTEKLYYEDSFLYETEATILAIDGREVITDRTVFFPEGGGQVGDQGYLGELRIIDTQKRGGHLVMRDGLPTVSVETEVVHIAEGDTSQYADGDCVALRIDSDRRDGCRRIHSAVHLVMGQVNRIFGEDSYQIKGCCIEPDRGRIDFATPNRLGGAVLEQIRAGIEEWIASDAAVEMLPVADVPEMFIWHCEAAPDLLDQPCGGTHVRRLGEIGNLRFKRSREGKNLERIYVRLAEDGEP